MLASRRAAVLLAILAMTLRGLLPAGWMPNPDGMRETALIICDMGGASPSGMNMVHMDHASGMDMGGADPESGAAPMHKHADDGHSQPCPFAAAPHFATLSVLALLSPPSLAARFVHRHAPEGRRIAAAFYTPQSPRAPPHLA